MITREALKRTSARIGIAGTLVLSSCVEAPQTFDYGERAKVVDLEFIPEHSEQRNGICILRQSGVCLIRDKYDVVVPNAYIVTLEQCESPHEESEIRCITEEIETTVDGYEIAQEYNYVTVERDGTLTGLSG